MYIDVPTPKEMSAWDKQSVVLGVSEDVLMENASRAAVNVLCKYIDPAGKHILIIAGGGNNGGDSFCMARHLQKRGAHVLVCYTKSKEEYKEAAKRNFELLEKLGISVVPLSHADFLVQENCELHTNQCYTQPDIVIDGLFGTGFHGKLDEHGVQIINWLNNYEAFHLAIDVPSGLNSLIGSPSPIAFKADVTVTFEAPKCGLLMPTAKEYIGILEVVEIGIPCYAKNKNPSSFYTFLLKGIKDFQNTNLEYRVEFSPSPALLNHIAKDLAFIGNSGILPSHKGEAGKVFLIGGAPNYAGAPCFAALGAIRAGAGLVYAAVPRELLPIIHSLVPAVVTPLCFDEEVGPKSEKKFVGGTPPEIFFRADVIILGPGMGRENSTVDFIEYILSLESRPCCIIDADALFALSVRPSLLSLLKEDDILTPHPGEAAAILGITTGEVQRDRIGAAGQLLEKANAIWVLKGEGTIITSNNNKIFLSPFRVPQLAVAGSGDVLTGIIAAFKAKGESAEQAAVKGVCTHAIAGSLLADKYDNRGNTPQEIADAVSAAIKFL